MKTYDELKALIEQRGVHSEFGEPGEGWGIEQNPHELATFLVRMQEIGVQSVLEIGTGYKGGLSRFLAQDMGWDVTTVDVKNYGHVFEGVHYVILATDPLSNGIRYLSQRQYDLVFIDGNHDLHSVAADYSHHELFATKVVAFHDIEGLRNCEGAKQFWDELTKDAHVGGSPTPEPPYYRTRDYSPRIAGIGWIEL
jgi:predicted O-methyltransferase YrrM